jgi:YfiH family protein
MMPVVAPLTSATLAADGLVHGFFTRQGGVSEGVYASLNGGVGSRDVPVAVAENRARMAAALGIAPARLLVPYQIHSAEAVVVAGPWADDARPRCDALVTATPGIGLGVTGADCGMILFRDAQARVIGAAHAGWKGALTGVLEATIAAMIGLGATRGRIVAALGPTIGPGSYEVGPEFVARFIEADPGHAAFFRASAKAAHSMFDLPAFIGHRLRSAGIGDFEDLALDTYSDDERFFSYRRTVHRSEPDYGRLVSAIALV